MSPDRDDHAPQSCRHAGHAEQPQRRLRAPPSAIVHDRRSDHRGRARRQRRGARAGRGVALGRRPGSGVVQPTPGVGFLAWFPSTNTANAGVDPGNATSWRAAARLEPDFQDLILGVHEYGCGIESQLESWYRFLIQPDPYASLRAGANNSQATWVGVDTTIIQERHDFLRPDSLVAIIVLSDENDSEIDVRSIGGQGYLFMSTKFYPPHGTVGVRHESGGPGLHCPANSTRDRVIRTARSMPTTRPPTGAMTSTFAMCTCRQKYGLDPQFPITRYVNGLTSTIVPDRTGEYPANAANYVGNNDCTNPLFAATLPSASQLSANAATAGSDVRRRDAV